MDLLVHATLNINISTTKTKHQSTIMVQNANNNNIVDLVAGTEAIEKSSVVVSTRNGYTNRLVEFMLWIWKKPHQRDVLSLECIQKVQMAQNLDNQLTASRRRRNPNMRKALQQLMGKVERNNAGTSPIKLEGDGCLTYKLVSDFMSTKNKVATVDAKLASEFKKAMRNVTNKEGTLNEDAEEFAVTGADENGQVRVSIRQEVSTYSGIRSAVAFLYREAAVKMDESMNASLSLYIKGSLRMNLLAKQTMGLKLSEGKKHMTKEVFSKIAKILFCDEDPRYTFAHLFFVLDW